MTGRPEQRAMAEDDLHMRARIPNESHKVEARSWPAAWQDGSPSGCCASAAWSARGQGSRVNDCKEQRVPGRHRRGRAGGERRQTERETADALHSISLGYSSKHTHTPSLPSTPIPSLKRNATIVRASLPCGNGLDTHHPIRGDVPSASLKVAQLVELTTYIAYYARRPAPKGGSPVKRQTLTKQDLARERGCQWQAADQWAR